MATKKAKASGIVTTADALSAHAVRITVMTESSATTTLEVGAPIACRAPGRVVRLAVRLRQPHGGLGNGSVIANAWISSPLLIPERLSMPISLARW